jgi:hypothetical protein
MRSKRASPKPRSCKWARGEAWHAPPLSRQAHDDRAKAVPHHAREIRREIGQWSSAINGLGTLAGPQRAMV